MLKYLSKVTQVRFRLDTMKLDQRGHLESRSAHITLPPVPEGIGISIPERYNTNKMTGHIQ